MNYLKEFFLGDPKKVGAQMVSPDEVISVVLQEPEVKKTPNYSALMRDILHGNDKKKEQMKETNE